MRSKQLNLQNLIHHLCIRPQMYVQGGTFQEAIGLLWGYHLGLLQCCPEKETEWERFNLWASQKYHCPSAVGYWNVIAEKYPDDASRFRRLRFVFKKFAKSKLENTH